MVTGGFAGSEADGASGDEDVGAAERGAGTVALPFAPSTSIGRAESASSSSFLSFLGADASTLADLAAVAAGAADCFDGAGEVSSFAGGFTGAPWPPEGGKRTERSTGTAD